MKVIRKIKPTINRSSSRIKSRSGLNSTRGVINKTTPRTASLVLLPSLAVLAMFMVVIISVAPNASAADDDSSQYANSGSSSIMAETSTTFSIEDEKSIGVTLSSNEVILNINPTSSGTFNSASMTVDVSTNNITGYNLTMTADKTDLSRTIAINGTTPTIPTIPTGKTFTEDTFENGYWGYKLGTDTTYLPMTTDNIQINTTDAASNSSINTITFASKLNNSTPSGIYSGVALSFIATTNAVPAIDEIITTLQDFAALSSNDRATVLDSMVVNKTYTKSDARDTNKYKIAKLADGNVWMVENLRFVSPNILAATSNVTSDITDITWYELDTSNCSGTKLTDFCYKAGTDLPSGNPTVWYNYAAATAGTIVSSSNSAEATQSICPKGWKLPSHSQFAELISYPDTFSPVYGGIYTKGSLDNPGTRGSWWSSTAYTSALRYNLSYTNGAMNPGNSSHRYGGFYVRCIFSPASLISFTISGTTYQAEEGMTWAEWVDSNYNIDEYSISYALSTDGMIIKGNRRVNSAQTGIVKPTDVISADTSYDTSGVSQPS